MCNPHRRSGCLYERRVLLHLVLGILAADSAVPSLHAKLHLFHHRQRLGDLRTLLGDGCDFVARRPFSGGLLQLDPSSLDGVQKIASRVAPRR